MDIMVRSLRAGHPVRVAGGLVAQELPDRIGTEFGIAADEITYGADVETAMRNLYFRVGQEDLPLFVTAVAIQGSTGGNLGEILANLSAVIRERFKMRRKIRALAAEGRASALILSSLRSQCSSSSRSRRRISTTASGRRTSPKRCSRW